MNDFFRSDLFFKIAFVIFLIFVATIYAEWVGFQSTVLVLLVLIWSDVIFKDV